MFTKKERALVAAIGLCALSAAFILVYLPFYTYYEHGVESIEFAAALSAIGLLVIAFAASRS